MAVDNSKFLKKIKCFYTKRVGFGINIHGFLDQQIEVRQNMDGTRSIIKFPPFPKRAKIDRDGYFEVLDHKLNREKLKGLVTEGMVRILDEDLEFEIMGENKIEKINEIVEEIIEEKVYIKPEDGKIAFNRRKPFGPEEKRKRQEIAKKAREAKFAKKLEQEKKAGSKKIEPEVVEEEEDGIVDVVYVSDETDLMENDAALDFIDSEK